MFKAKIKSKKIVAKGTLETEYDLLGKKVKFKPGQIFNITLPENLEHHFTIVNSPNEVGVVVESLEKAGVQKNNIKTENFYGY